MGEKKSGGKLRFTIPLMTCGPLFLFGIIAIIVCSMRFSSAIYEKVEGELEEIASSVLLTYDLLYDGEYRIVKNNNVVAYFKGDHEITGDFSIIDMYSSHTQSEISIFYKDTRMITTLTNKDYERLIGSGANSVIVKDVIDNKQSVFYNKVNIDGIEYYAYYRPIFTQNGACIGMLAIAKKSSEINLIVLKTTTPIISIIFIAMVIASVISYIYASNLGTAIGKVEKALAKVAKGDLNSELDYGITKRNDEIADIGRSIVAMQNSLHNLVEKDALTGLYNRRLANKKLDKVIKDRENVGINYCVALGDIDFFKKVNDTYGHEMGDEVLKAVSATMKNNMRGNGFVARWGGEEFLLVFEDKAIDAAYGILSAILNEVRGMEVDGRIRVTMTFGLVEGYDKAISDALIKTADDNLYYGKEHGRNQIVIQKSPENNDAE